MVSREHRASRAVVVALLAAQVVATVHVAHAQSVDAAAEAEFRVGFRALQAGNCTEALVHYRRSLELVQRPRTIFNIATCEEDLGQDSAAWRDYLSFLSLAEDRDATIVAEAKARIEALRKRLHGQVAVGSSPSRASVTVDGERQPRGETPINLTLEPGRHSVKLALAGSSGVERTVDVAPDDRTSLQVELAPSSQIAIKVDPPDATIDSRTEDATAVGVLDVTVNPGHHTYEIHRLGYRSERVEVDAVSGHTHEVRVSLRPEPPQSPTLIVSGALGATIVLDGDKRSVAERRELLTVPVGDHDVAIEHRGHVIWRRGLQFSPQEIVKLDVDLSPARSTSRRVLTWSIAGVGLASLTAGGVVGTLALRDVTSDNMDVHERGKTRALVADGLFVAGATALVVAWRLLKSDATARVSRESEAP